MRTVTVVGHGTVRVVPDTAVVRVAAAHGATGVKEALAGVSSTVEAIGEVARRYTDESRIASHELTVWPSLDYEGMPAGFQARHALAISCDDLGRAGELVAALASEVGDRLQIEGLALEVSDPGAAQASAREAAYADATERAAHLAKLAGAKVGELQMASEGVMHVPSIVGDGAATAAYASKMEVGFEPGETAVAASVTVDLPAARGPIVHDECVVSLPVRQQERRGLSRSSRADGLGDQGGGEAHEGEAAAGGGVRAGGVDARDRGGRAEPAADGGPALPEHAHAASRPSARPGRAGCGRSG